VPCPLGILLRQIFLALALAACKRFGGPIAQGGRVLFDESL
jgi:hypothetical protein